MPRAAVAIVLALGVPLLGGCVFAYRPPAIQVAEATVTDRTEEAVRFDIVLHLENPNAEPLEIREFVYTVSLDGRRVFNGRRAGEATLAGGGTSRMVLPAVARLDEMPVAPVGEGSWSIRGRLLYLTPDVLAEILLDSKLYRPRVRFTGRGDVAFDSS